MQFKDLYHICLVGLQDQYNPSNAQTPDNLTQKNNQNPQENIKKFH